MFLTGVNCFTFGLGALIVSPFSVMNGEISLNGKDADCHADALGAVLFWDGYQSRCYECEWEFLLS